MYSVTFHHWIGRNITHLMIIGWINDIISLPAVLWRCLTFVWCQADGLLWCLFCFFLTDTSANCGWNLGSMRAEIPKHEENETMSSKTLKHPIVLMASAQLGDDSLGSLLWATVSPLHYQLSSCYSVFVLIVLSQAKCLFSHFRFYTVLCFFS